MYFHLIQQQDALRVFLFCLQILFVNANETSIMRGQNLLARSLARLLAGSITRFLYIFVSNTGLIIC